MARAKVKGRYTGNKFKIDLEVSVFTWEENGTYFAYAPALDLTGYDRTEKGAKDSFSFILSSTLEYLTNKKTLFDKLERLGWTVNRKKKRVTAPTITEVIDDNSEFRNLLERDTFKKEVKGIQLELA